MLRQIRAIVVDLVGEQLLTIKLAGCFHGQILIEFILLRKSCLYFTLRFFLRISQAKFSGLQFDL